MASIEKFVEPQVYSHVIIGGGFGGLCAAIKLQECGEEDFIILERADSVGGVWRDNSYPGCACDIATLLYSFSFEQNAEWSRVYPSQQEIWNYLNDIAEKYKLVPKIRFKHNVLETVYDEAENLWRVHTEHGVYTARIVISATGGLSEPAIPDIPGMNAFRGAMFHSAQWDHTFDVRGKRVAVVGTGASGIQIVPEIAPAVKQLDVFQRTPAWVTPRGDREIRPWEKALRRTPLLRLLRWFAYLRCEATAVGFTCWPSLLRFMQRMLLRNLNRQVRDPFLRAKVTPAFTLGCKRVLLSDDWYPALQRPNVNLITESIKEIGEKGIVTQDGKLHEADAIVWSTGFQVTDNPIASRVFGRGGLSLADVWEDGEEAYLGTLVHGFPNFFLITGPNTGIGHTSLVFMIESQMTFIMDCLRVKKRRNLDVIEVSREAQDRFNARIQARTSRTVWATGGCKSWYLNKNGKNTTLWPGFTVGFWWQLRRCRIDDLILQDEPVQVANPVPGCAIDSGSAVTHSK